jgi:hypothetical protein
MMSRLQRRNHIYNKIFFGNIQCSPLPLRRSSLQSSYQERQRDMAQ